MDLNLGISLSSLNNLEGYLLGMVSQFARQLSLSSFPPNPQNLKSLCSNGQLREALLEMAAIGLEMKFDGYYTLLNECINRRAFGEGQRVHAHMIKTCYLPPMHLGTRLIVFYNNCDRLGDARRVLDEMPERNVVSWTAMVSAYSKRGYASEALNLFLQMFRSGILLLLFELCKCIIQTLPMLRVKIIRFSCLIK